MFRFVSPFDALVLSSNVKKEPIPAASTPSSKGNWSLAPLNDSKRKSVENLVDWLTCGQPSYLAQPPSLATRTTRLMAISISIQTSPRRQNNGLVPCSLRPRHQSLASLPCVLPHPSFPSNSSPDVEGLAIRLCGLTRGAKRMDINEIDKEFMVFLRELWDKLVSHIVDVLLKTCPRNLHIWRCPTAKFSLLPLHATAPYRPHRMGLSEIYIPSYTPTSTALICARCPTLHDSTSEKPRFVAIAQAAPKGATELCNVSAEPNKIGQLVDGRATFTRIEGEDSRISTVANALGKNSRVHFACDGILNYVLPFETAFALRDGKFAIQHIGQCDLQNPDFAYLSACNTTVGDQQSPDEVVPPYGCNAICWISLRHWDDGGSGRFSNKQGDIDVL